MTQKKIVLILFATIAVLGATGAIFAAFGVGNIPIKKAMAGELAIFFGALSVLAVRKNYLWMPNRFGAPFKFDRRNDPSWYWSTLILYGVTAAILGLYALLST